MTVSRLPLVGIAAATASILVLSTGFQIYDSNFVVLSETPSILAGDHPYRDFFEWGGPLAAYLSAGMQWLVGYRLIGEFLLDWVLITAGVTIAFALGTRVSGSSVATALAMIPALVTLAFTSVYHATKLFFIPLAIWLAWRYLDAPTVKRSLWLGIATATAFLVRHDHGLYVGFASLAAFVLAPVFGRGLRGLRSLATCGSVYVAAIVIVTAPWAGVVARSEGLRDYVQARASKYEGSFGSAYRDLHWFSALRELVVPPPPPPAPGIVGFGWRSDIDVPRQQQLEREFVLQPLGRHDEMGRALFAVSNVYDVRLLKLDSYINDGWGFQWQRLRELERGTPQPAQAGRWIEQTVLIVPVLLLVSIGATLATATGRSSAHAPHLILATAVLLVVNAAVIREPGYAAVVAPLTASLSSRFFVRSPDSRTADVSTAPAPERMPRAAVWTRQAFAWGVLLLSTYAAIMWWPASPLFHPMQAMRSFRPIGAAVLASPPIAESSSQLFRYLNECTVPGDRLVVTGSTPFNVTYFTQRPMAGGHLYWHSGWRSDPRREEESLTLLRRQSVPFAVSTHDPVLDDFKMYPRIRQYLIANYKEVDGSHGTVLADIRRHAVRTFGPDRMPCFR